MRAVSNQSHEIIDLTSHDEAIPYSPRSERRKRTLYVSLLDEAEGGDTPVNGDDEPEVIETHSVARPRPVNPTDPSLIEASRRPDRRRRQQSVKARRRASSDDLVVVSERQLTPQERLREIQEQHRQGKSVNPHQGNVHNPHLPPASLAGSNAAALYTQHLLGGPLGPMRGRLIVPPRPRGQHAARPRIWHTRAPLGAPMLPGLPLGHLHETLEQRDYEQALLRSLEETTRRRELDRTKLLLPPPAAPAREGFTRSLAVDQPLVCIRCERELGKPDPALEDGLSAETKLQHNKVFVRGCGHVYCGRCTYSMKLLPTRARSCLPDCMQVSAKKRGTFREVFI